MQTLLDLSIDEHPMEGKGYRVIAQSFGSRICVAQGFTSREEADGAQACIEEHLPFTVNQAKRAAESEGFEVP